MYHFCCLPVISAVISAIIMDFYAPVEIIFKLFSQKTSYDCTLWSAFMYQYWYLYLCVHLIAVLGTRSIGKIWNRCSPEFLQVLAVCCVMMCAYHKLCLKFITMNHLSFSAIFRYTTCPLKLHYIVQNIPRQCCQIAISNCSQKNIILFIKCS